ncbi:uncharacterized protein EI90DRAFT_2091882 [Cantharellus anzutake]|uniref:uncharacterized protein n=1 Tax=Cantharellus anzutake TaxID=1750568 RepID=UPI001905DE28|nr:uncharacterized protein EI90DRAFT_2091882 [Cantharellus anzutake]KAF8340639.1 hypothetical protein EI90DRAFT_2091882 [Cantharellus anzutake]
MNDSTRSPNFKKIPFLFFHLLTVILAFLSQVPFMGHLSQFQYSYSIQPLAYFTCAKPCTFSVLSLFNYHHHHPPTTHPIIVSLCLSSLFSLSIPLSIYTQRSSPVVI